MQILLTTALQAAETVVIYDTVGTDNGWFVASVEYDDLGVGDGLALVTELSVHLGLCVED